MSADEDSPDLSLRPRRMTEEERGVVDDQSSDVDRLMEQAEKVSGRAEALGTSIIQVMTEDNLKLVKQNDRIARQNRWMFCVLIVLALLVSSLVYRSLFDTGPVIERLGRQQADITELVNFVREVRRDQDDQDDGASEGPDLQVFVDLLCATDVPERKEICAGLAKTEGE